MKLTLDGLMRALQMKAASVLDTKAAASAMRARRKAMTEARDREAISRARRQQ
ncbi:hypothetical protein [Neoaquamicrobium sediminum]|uniref:Uncharacterized protein n=1 Tax=Neoaquamicrobium sediminum TaxID=1849104 RepID=A0ABV3WT41_9HYPH